MRTAEDRTASEALAPDALRSTAEPSEARHARRLGPAFWIASAWIILVVLGALLAGVLPIDSPYALAYTPLAGPSLHHLFGTDELGRDTFSRVVYGARISLEVGFGSMVVGLGIGGTAGLIAGYVQGTFDAISNMVANLILSFPALLLLMAVVAFWGRAWWQITVIIGVIAIAPLFRVVRASSLSFSGRDFVVAAKALGATRWRILTRELLPNVLPAAVSISLIGVALAIVAEGTLSFLGLSVAPPTPTWGNLIAEGQSSIARSDAWITFWPSVVMFLTLLALNVVGDRLQHRFDVREGRL